MEYNISRTKLILPEYGRNIQKMVEYVKTIKDEKEKNNAARTIIAVMGNLNPHLRDINDFKHKLWDHLAIISNFELDVDSPYPTPEREKLFEKPAPPERKKGNIKYKHYGRIVQQLIEKAIDVKDKNEQAMLIKIIATHMKKSYNTWHNENINEEIIFETIRELSDYKLKIPENIKIDDFREKRRKRNK